MKLTKQIEKKAMVMVLVLTSMAGMVFASGSTENSSSPVISGAQSWTGVIDGIAIDLTHYGEENMISGTVSSLLQTDVSNAQVIIDDANGTNLATITLGTPGDLEFHDTMIKENTIVLGGYTSVPVEVLLSDAESKTLLDYGWKVSIDSDNAPKYGLFEKGELLAKEATSIANSFVINEDGVQTAVSFSYEDEGFSGTVTNNTDKAVSAVEITIALNNGSVFTSNANSLQPGETASFSYGSGVSGFSSYAVETTFN